MSGLNLNTRINLEKAEVLLLDESLEGMGILMQIVNAFAPTMLVSGHTQLRNVQRARDCGANYIVAKPVSPDVLLERIIWVAREKRPFIQCDSYFGPDRRVHDTGPPPGVAERRKSADSKPGEAA